MKTALLLLLAITLLNSLIHGVVLQLILIIIKVTGHIALTRQTCWGLYILATLIVFGLLWLFVKIGGH